MGGKEGNKYESGHDSNGKIRKNTQMARGMRREEGARQLRCIAF